MTLDRTYEEAAAWLARQHGQAMDWEAFMVWLEADPRNRAAFDAMALLDSELDENASRISKVIARDDLSSANGLPGVRWATWVGFGGAAVAASLAGLPETLLDGMLLQRCQQRFGLIVRHADDAVAGP